MNRNTEENKKALCKWFMFLMLALLSAFLTNSTAYAEKNTVPLVDITDGTAEVIKLYNNKTVHGLLFRFEYDASEPEFVLIAPDGTVYDPKTSNNDFTSEKTDKGMDIKIFKADKGQWKLQFNKTDRIKVEILDYEPEMAITGFEAGFSKTKSRTSVSITNASQGGIAGALPGSISTSQGSIAGTISGNISTSQGSIAGTISGNIGTSEGSITGNSEGSFSENEIENYEVSDKMVNWRFLAKHEKKFWFKYSLYISKNNEFDGSERLISTGEAYTGREMTGSTLVDAEDGEYYFLLETEYEISGKTVKCRTCSNRFKYIDSEEIPSVEDFKIEADKEKGTIRISWDSEDMPWASKVRLTVTEDGVCTFKQNYDVMPCGAVVKIDKESKEIKVSLACGEGNRFSNETKKSFMWSQPDGFHLVDIDGNSRNDYTWRYSYENAGEQKIIEEIAGIKTETVLSGDGERILELNGNPCEVIISYEDDYGVIWKYKETVYQDTDAPGVELFSDYTNVYTDQSSIEINGRAEPGSEISINGVYVKADEDGSFSYLMSLNFGANPMVLKVSDQAGNESIINGNIQMVSSSEYLSDYKNSGFFTFLERYPEACALASSIVAVVVILLVVFFFVRKWSRISQKAREQLLKYPDYAEGRTIQRVRRAGHMKMTANLFLGLFLIDLFLCIIGCLTGYYVSRLSQFDTTGSLLPEAFLSMYSLSITVDELFIILKYMSFAGIILLALTILTQWMASSVRKRADQSLVIEEKKLNKRMDKSAKAAEKSSKGRKMRKEKVTELPEKESKKPPEEETEKMPDRETVKYTGEETGEMQGKEPVKQSEEGENEDEKEV